ncbi:hypothetical protein OG225_28000 [Nocardia sp. NBC_01377]|uniref:hypothetical protein n=1 Tax=Nocardia sp. NBC_01377 TaxID=2903595 RepID=UPI00324C6745
MGAYSTTPLRSAPEVDEPQAPASERHDESTRSESAHSGSAHGESTQPVRAVPRVLFRILGWVFFVAGLVGAVFGIAGLHVEITVAGLILACTSGLVLLKLRADKGKPGD